MAAKIHAAPNQIRKKPEFLQFGGNSRFHPVPDQLPPELCNAGEDPEHKSTVRGAGVHAFPKVLLLAAPGIGLMFPQVQTS